MATLTGQSIASSYEQLLHVDADGGGNSTTHVSVKDGDNGTTFGFTIASDALMMSSTNRLEFGDTGTYINQSGDGILNITSDTEVEINATAVDLNGTLDVSGTLTVGADGSGTDVIFYSGTAGDNFTWDASEECLIITGTDAAQALKVADGDLVVVDKIYLYDNDGGEYLSSDGTDLTITSGNDIVLSPTGNVDHNANYIVNEQGRQDHVANTMPAPYYRFDGDDSIKIDDTANIDFTNDLSISIRFNTESVTGVNTLLGKYHTSGTYSYLIYLNGDELEYIITSDGSTICSQTTTALNVEIGKEYHVSVVYDASAQTIVYYVNGAVEASTTTAGSVPSSIHAGTADLFIGAYGTGTSNPFNGQISDVKIFNLALSATEVKELYSGASVPFKYKGANQTNLFDADAAAGTVVDNWTVYGSNTIAVVSSAITITYTGGSPHNAGAYIYLRDNQDLTSDLTIGKKYRFSCDAHFAGGSAGVKLYLHDGSAAFESDALPEDSAVRQNIEFTAQSETACYLQLVSMGASNVVTLDNLSLVPIGAVAEYDGSGVGASRWDDKSGNELHGTVSGATVENAPADADSGLTYEEGTWTPDNNGGTISVTPVYATYTKIGRLVTIHCYVTLAADGDSTEMSIGGLPFTVATNGYSPSIVNSGDTSGKVVQVRAQSGQTNIFFCNAISQGTLNEDEIENQHLIFTLSYNA